MLLSEIFDHLNFGELSQLSLGDSLTVGIDQSNYPALISHINLGLTELYKRLPLRIRTIDIKLVPGLSTYILKSEFAITSNSTQPNKYLLDSVSDPFISSHLLKIETIKVKGGGIIPLNDLSKADSIFSTAFNILKIPEDNSLDTISVDYRSSTNKINITNLDPSTEEVSISDSLLEPLVYFIASRAHANIPSLDGNPSESITYLQKFEASISKIQELGLVHHDHGLEGRFRENGWV